MTKIQQIKTVELPVGIAFRNPDTGARSLSRIRERLAADVFSAFCHFLAESPDPDQVVIFLERLVEVAPEDLRKAFATQPILLRFATLIFGHSAWLGETLIQNTDLFHRFGRNETLDRSYSREQFREEFAHLRAQATENNVALLLGRFKKRSYVRILLRDVLGIAKLAETTEEISALADVLIDEALVEVHAQSRERYGTPKWVDANAQLHAARFAVVSLGKLGGNELNYSSDVDLLFLYDGGSQPPGAAISSREYFIRLAQQTTELLCRRTLEGQVFRIDLRLRPQGRAGEIAVGLAKAIQYYSEVAQDWELQAMIKARHSAGNPDLTREFTRAIAPYVYRPNVNFAAVKTALQSRERIDRRDRKNPGIRRPVKAIDVKLDRGGIRDIEFLVQCLQRVYGGEEAWLRSRGTLFALQKLHDKEHISGKDFHNLTKAYEFLRHLEHQLQLRHGRQSHHLPTSQTELTVLAQCMNRAYLKSQTADEFVLQVQGRMAAVAEIYRHIVFQEQSHQFIDTAGELRLQVQVPPSAENSYSQIMQRLATDAPKLLSAIARAELSPHARRNVDRFFSATATSSDRYGAVLRSAEAVERSVKIFEVSQYLTDILVRFPADVSLLSEVDDREVADSAALFAVPCDPVAETPDPILTYLARSSVDRRDALGLFRQQFRSALFMANARDLYHPQEIYATLKENSNAAEKALGYALAVAGAPSGFAVMALGRLGSREFDILSDADVLFVAEEGTVYEDAVRAAGRIIEALTAYTHDGTLFPVDTRLRPRGREGELVITPAQITQYFARDASSWEVLTYLRLRYVAGDRGVAERVMEASYFGITEAACRAEFDHELGQMRQRLVESDNSPNFKTGEGGVYDIDYLVGRLQAKHQLWSHGNLSERVDLIAREGFLADDEARELAQCARFLRALEHYIRLVTGRPDKWLPVQEHAIARVAELMSRAELLILGQTLDSELKKVLRNIRQVSQDHPF